MGAAEKIEIPYRECWVDAGEIGRLLGRPRRYVLEKLACKQGFPAADRDGQPRWNVGEVLDWQRANRASQQARRRSSGSR